MLFTDTLADVNGVSRFIQNMAACARAQRRELRVVTSTPLRVPDEANLQNVRPIWSGPMPLYPMLSVAWPSQRRLWAAACEFGPDVIHVSTPGPVGIAGRRIAKRLGVPLVGTYHTDFPAYVERLAGDHVLGRAARATMTWFYRPFSAVFTRSEAYRPVLEELGVAPDRVRILKAGIDLAQFDRGFRDPAVWERAGLPAEPGVATVMYCGRVSVEKNLPLLERVWRGVRTRLSDGSARLVVVGDGPYLKRMRTALADTGVHFLGFRHGDELATMYASADVFVFPSTTDTLGQAVMEAQASGLPAVVSDVGGPAKVVADGESGVVVSAADERAWEEAIVRMVRDKSARSAMSQAAYGRSRPWGIAASFDEFWRAHEELTAGV